MPALRRLRILILCFALGGLCLSVQRLRGSFAQALRDGSIVEIVMGHGDPLPEREPLYKPFSELTEEERQVKRDLESQAIDEVRGDVVVKRNGSRIRGRIVEDTPRGIKIVQSFRGSGEMVMPIPRSSIVRVERSSESAPDITYRDIRFKIEFPKLNLYRRPPFSVMTPKNYFEVEGATGLLSTLHRQFKHAFSPLFTKPEGGKSIQLLFFDNEDQFQEYRKEHAPAMAYAAGFYSPWKDRLVIFDQKHSEQAAEIAGKIDDMKEQYADRMTSRAQRFAASRWQHESKRALSRYSNQMTKRLLRHEGAHQLFYTYGVHAEEGGESLWLIEGLAGYAENQNIGDRPEEFIEFLNGEGRTRMLPFKRLVDYADRTGFSGLVSDEDVTIPYAQSAVLVYHLMRPENRERFFEFVRFVRDPENAPSGLGNSSQYDLLCRTLGTTPDALEQRLLAELR